MTRLILPIVLIGAAIGLFMIFTDPLYKQVKTLATERDNYNAALSNSKEILKERDVLVEKYNSFPAAEVAKLDKLLPNNVDNIRLIIELETLGLRNGLILKDAKVESVSDGKIQTLSKEKENVTPSAENPPAPSSSIYNSMDISFSIEGSYQNFLKFVGDLDKSLRIVDVQSVTFSSLSDKDASSYLYNFKIRTYWLKD